GISVDASDDIKNFTITAVLDGCDSVTAEQVWIYPNLMTVGNNNSTSDNGQYTLGNGTLTNTNTYGAIGPYRVWEQIGGRWHGMAMSNTSELWAWGANAYGQVGNNTKISRPKPILISDDWIDIGNGWGNSLGINSSNFMYTWGLNNWGQLGNGDKGTATTGLVLKPTRIAAGTLASVRWSSVIGGNTHSLALTDDKHLYAWGDNSYGQLNANPNTYDEFLNPSARAVNFTWLEVAAGAYYSMGIQEDGTLWSWGRNDYGQLGIGSTTTTYNRTQVGTATNWTQVKTQYWSSFAINSDGELWAWGYNNSGQLGLGDTTSRNVPTQVVVPGVQWAHVSPGAGEAMAITTDGWLYTWGNNNSGELGLGNNDTPVLTPQKVGHMQWDLAEFATYASYGVAKTFVPQGYAY
ncbi:MAG: hypothetical protein QM571_05810, partial [Micrococcaceae bacterium]